MFAWSRKQEPRLENWDGRKHSTRDSVSMMPCVWTKGLIARLGLVSFSACGLIAILFINSPPFPYRFGSTLPHDFRARVAFEVPNQAFTAHHLDSALDAAAEDADPDTVTG